MRNQDLIDYLRITITLCVGSIGLAAFFDHWLLAIGFGFAAFVARTLLGQVSADTKRVLARQMERAQRRRQAEVEMMEKAHSALLEAQISTLRARMDK
ncbi:MAG: hypothetical protein MO847_05020 [Candidatus Protistobacter heckmanni]|nr:hypothetical protein [Candidatus Protistobacter heckmanni]